MTTAHRPVAASLFIAAVALFTAILAPTAGAVPGAAAAACNVTSVAHKLGASTVSGVSVKNVTCAKGIAVVKAFHACRLAHGKSGRCVKLVLGYACREQRMNAPTQINGSVTCSKGTATVSHRYVQTL